MTNYLAKKDRHRTVKVKLCMCESYRLIFEKFDSKARTFISCSSTSSTCFANQILMKTNQTEHKNELCKIYHSISLPNSSKATAITCAHIMYIFLQRLHSKNSNSIDVLCLFCQELFCIACILKATTHACVHMFQIISKSIHQIGAL